MMKAGTYYIGDLCYVMSDRWSEVCHFICSENDEGEFELPDGAKFACYNTTWGDGEYYDNYGNRYAVDSGTIGCVLISDLVNFSAEDVAGMCSIVTFESDFITGSDCDRTGKYHGTGNIVFGNVYIETDPRAPEYEDDFDEDDYDPDEDDTDSLEWLDHPQYNIV